MAHHAPSTSTGKGISSLRSRFEPAPAPVPQTNKKERIKSTVDPLRPVLSTEAARIRQVAKAITTSSPTTPTEKPFQQEFKQYATDSDAVRKVKGDIIEKDKHLNEATRKLNEVANCLDKLLDRFTSSVVADEYDPTANNNNGNNANSNDVNDDKRTSAANVKLTSLEDILKAARGGSASPKYSKLMRDLN